VSRRRRSPRPLSLALQPQSGRWRPDSSLGLIQSVWQQAVGERIAAEAIPLAERNGLLTVSCSASVWAQELELSSGLIITRLCELAPGVSISRLRCVCDGGRDGWA
jgi:predicted nucleic acid-binding Zn ribbon protein